MLVTNEISASTLGIPAPISTTNGACLTPRSRSSSLLGLSFLTIAFWTISAKSRDSSILLFSVIARTISGRLCIDLPDAEFSRAATAAASGFEAKLRK